MASKKQIEACRLNWAKHQGHTPAALERSLKAALPDKSWEHSTG